MNFNRILVFVNLLLWIVIGLFHIRDEHVSRIHYFICWIVLVLEGLNLLLIMDGTV